MGLERRHSRRERRRQSTGLSPDTSPRLDNPSTRSRRDRFRLSLMTAIANRRATPVAPARRVGLPKEGEPKTTWSNAKSASLCSPRQFERPTFGVPRPEQEGHESERQHADAE